MKNAALWIIHILFLFFAAFNAVSQNAPTYEKFIHITKSKGLSNNSITCIEKDTFGFIWVGTQNGLNRFDGEKFKIFRNNKKDSSSLSSNLIHALGQDSDGIWIGTDQGINRYNYKTGFIERLHHTSMKGVGYKRIISICTMKDEKVWFGTQKGIFILDKKHNRFTFYGNTDNQKKLFEESRIMNIFQDSKNTIWIGTAKGLYTADTKNPNKIIFSRIYGGASDLQDIDVLDITADVSGNLWIATRNKGLLLYSKFEKTLRQHQNPYLPRTNIRVLQFDPFDNLWIGSFDGLTILQKDGKIIKPKYLSEKGFTIGDGVNSFFLDDKIGLWIGGNFGGLKVWNTPYNSIKNITSLEVDKTIDLGLVNALGEDKTQNIYVGTKKNGVFVLDQNRNVQKDLTRILMDRLFGVTVKSLVFENNLLWIGTREKGLLTFDPEKRQFLDHLASEELNLLLKYCKIYSMSIVDDLLAIGTFGKDLILFNVKTKEIKRHVIRANIRVVYFDRHRNLWIGTTIGLKKILANHIMNENPNILDFELSGQEKLNKKDITSITENENGQILVGSLGKGLHILKNGQFENSKLNVTSIHSIIKENKDLWLSSDKGIIKYNTTKNAASLFNQNYGLSDAEFRNQSSLKATNGIIYIGTSEGLLYFDPKQFNNEQKITPVVISDFKINGNEARNKEEINRNTLKSDKNRIALSHKETSFTINFSSFDYHSILNNLYEYRLVGLHENWKVTSEAEVDYIIQKPGDYLFQVRNTGILETENHTITELKIALSPAPWKSGYAYLLYALLGILIIAGFYWILKSKHTLEIENLKNSREREQFLSQIEFFTNLSHDFRTPLTLILAPLHQIIEQFKGSNVLFQKLLVVKRNGDHLLHLVNQILDFKKIDTEIPKLHVEQSNIIDSIQKVYKSFIELAESGKYSFVLEVPKEEVLLYYDTLVIERVIYNLLSNAFKNTHNGGKVVLTLQHSKEYVRVDIKDNGKGIDSEVIHKIFDRFYEVANDINYKKQFTVGTGIGLHMAKKAIVSHDGKLEVSSEKGSGTLFSMYLKKGFSHLQKYTANLPKNRMDSFDKKSPVLPTDSVDIPKTIISKLTNSKTKKHSILIVEDDDELRTYMTNILIDNFEVEEAADGHQGFAKAKQKKIDLIISDIVMPKMDGEKLCSKIKNDPRTKHIPFILLTTQISNSQKISGLQSGADAYIPKPFVVKEFLLIINNLLYTHDQIRNKLNKNDPDSLIYSELPSEDQKLYEEAMKIMKKNMGNSSFEITAFYSELGISRNKLFKKIKQWTDKTPKEFILLVRLKRASQLLETGEYTISQICYMTGFSSPNYFATVFKKHYEMTPTEYADKFTIKD